MSDRRDVAARVIEAVIAHDLAALRNLYASDARTRRPGWAEEQPDVELGPVQLGGRQVFRPSRSAERATAIASMLSEPDALYGA